MDNSSREKERDRTRRGDRQSRFSDATRDRSHDRDRDSNSRRLFVSNIPYEFRWSELKDLFKDKVGDVTFVELFHDENGKPRGCGVVEFASPEAVKKALVVLHRYELNGRKIVLKEDTSAVDRPHKAHPQSRHIKNDRVGRHDNMKDNWGMNKPLDVESFNTYGLSLQFLESINVQPPLVKKIFVANLDFKADRAKIKEVFKMAGKVRYVDLALDKDGNSRGFAIIEYDHPVEAVQAISMFDKQMLFDRRMTVRMDRGVSEKFEVHLPEGLKGIGLGLGTNGEPLRDVARNLPQQQASANNMPSAPCASVLGAVPNATVGLNGLGQNLNLGTNSTLGGNLGLQALGLTGLGALQNQLLQQGLTANDLATVLSNSTSLGLGNDLSTNILSTGMAGNPGASLNTNNSMNSLSSGPTMPGSNNRSMVGGSGSFNTRDKTSDMVVISNLPPTVTWQLIREKFSECGDVKFAEITTSDTAVVRFHKQWDAERAIKMFDNTRIDGRTIDVRYF